MNVVSGIVASRQADTGGADPHRPQSQPITINLSESVYTPQTIPVIINLSEGA